jgi:hypothetical protein
MAKSTSKSQLKSKSKSRPKSRSKPRTRSKASQSTRKASRRPISNGSAKNEIGRQLQARKSELETQSSPLETAKHIFEYPFEEQHSN